LVSAALAAAALCAAPKPAEATLVNGWNFFRIADCYASSQNGIDFIFAYDARGDFIFTDNPFYIGTTAQFCANGDAFYVNITVGSPRVNAFAFYPQTVLSGLR
jgi:hypothetical protein